MKTCEYPGCTKTVSKDGHFICYDHWKAERDGKISKCQKCGNWYQGSGNCTNCIVATKPADAESDGKFITTTRIGEQFNLSGIKVNLILAELGWIEKYVKGWIPTDRGNALGANVRESSKGVPYVVWPSEILQNKILIGSVKEQDGSSSTTHQETEKPAKPENTANKSDNFRDKFPANFRTQDGHQVRSRAEVMIDNWLYMQGIVHAYERRLPIEEECYCDFYLPKGKGVYIEFWGMENDPRYKERQAIKRGIYAKYKLQLIELGDAEIERLDDELPRRLLKFGIEST